MQTNVTVVYTPTLNMSVTRKGNAITRVTRWTTGVPGSTVREFGPQTVKPRAARKPAARKPRKPATVIPGVTAPRGALEREWQERVKKGIAFLDQKMPDWADKMDLSKFDLHHATACVLGQTVGDFWGALRRYNIVNADAVTMGFNADDRLRGEEMEADYFGLEKVWSEAIAHRQ